MRVTPDKVESIFPMPVAYYTYPNDKHEELKVAVRGALNRVRGTSNEDSSKLLHFYQNLKQHLLYDNDDPIFQHFHDWLQDCYTNMVEEVQGYKMNQTYMAATNCYITDCWVNITSDDGEQPPHFHVNSFISGTYYLTTPPGSGRLQFINQDTTPNHPNLGFDKYKHTGFNDRSHDIDVKERTLILWPSHLVHCTEKTKGDVRRVSISMNFLPKVFCAGAYNFKVVKHDIEDLGNTYRTSTQMFDED